MCGRYSISKKAREIAEYFGVIAPENIAGGVYNAAPTQLLPVIAMNQPRKLQQFMWGLQANWKNESNISPMLINIRAESLFEKKMFGNMLQTNKCLVMADGFFEWQKAGKSKQPWRFTLNDDSIFAFAAIFDGTPGPDGKIGFRFAIITTDANPMVSPIHNRMPVILDREGSMAWLSAVNNQQEIKTLLVPYPASKMKSYKVSPRVNSTAANSPELIKPWQDPNLTLF